MTFHPFLLAFVLVASGGVLLGQSKPSGKGKPVAPGAAKHCPRSEPKPIFSDKLPGVLSHSFVKSTKNDPNSRTAMETAVLASGDTVTVNHWGCRFFILTFDFASKERAPVKVFPAQGYLEAAQAIRQLIALKVKTGFNLDKAAKALEAAAKNPKVALIVPVSLGGKDNVAVKEVGLTEDKTKGHVQFEFMRGPL
jgi:hypothetical protein